LILDLNRKRYFSDVDFTFIKKLSMKFGNEAIDSKFSLSQEKEVNPWKGFKIVAINSCQ